MNSKLKIILHEALDKAYHFKRDDTHTITDIAFDEFKSNFLSLLDMLDVDIKF